MLLLNLDKKKLNSNIKGVCADRFSKIIKIRQKKEKNSLEKKLTKKEFAYAPRAFDSFGNIAVIEIPKELSKKKKVIDILAAELVRSEKSKINFFTRE